MNKKFIKQILISSLVLITVLGIVALYSPGVNLGPSSSTEEQENSSIAVESESPAENNLAASLTPAAVTSTAAKDSANSVASSSAVGPSFKDMQGFVGLGREDDLLKQLEVGSSADGIGGVDDIFEGFNQ